MISTLHQPKPFALARSRRGFTLIEIVVTLFIVTLIIGAATLTLSTAGPKKQLMRPAVKMKTFARKALALARNTQRPHSIFMSENFFVLRETHMREEDVNEALDPKKGEGSGRANFEVEDDAQEEDLPEVRVVERYDLAEGTQILVRRFGEKDFRIPKNEDWNFYTSGICDPIMIQFTTEDGFIEMEFNPLTAKVQLEGERFEIYKQD